LAGFHFINIFQAAFSNQSFFGTDFIYLQFGFAIFFCKILMKLTKGVNFRAYSIIKSWVYLLFERAGKVGCNIVCKIEVKRQEQNSKKLSEGKFVKK